MIYIISKGNKVTGGPETLHQLGCLLTQKGYQVSMYYEDPHICAIPERYQRYMEKVADQIVDNEDNLIIVPETMTGLLKNFKYAKICIWWLSLDFFNRTTPQEIVKWRMKEHQLPKVLYPFVFLFFQVTGKFKEINKGEKYRFDDNGRYFHLYNCDYARDFLLSHRIQSEKVLYLCGPLNKSYKEQIGKFSIENRENIVLYNPKKGRAFTTQLIKAAQKTRLKAKFIPLQNMQPDEIVNLMKRAKLYMDFGDFPGPERIPREAVTMGCNIITSKNGSAGNTTDVPIPDRFKFETKLENIHLILTCIERMLSEYQNDVSCFYVYRKKVMEQYPMFEKNAIVLLEKVDYHEENKI